ncbi:bifunctional folylpolyglutamate synthase/dihydrofolate synthase [Oceanotoga sp. DSM 15011]|jgi:dihydrofolate synthase/folylpolyglutamate synthase|uniref:Dihydrofolate synthase/folylpolyglutamate synthase n=1 Tax=Oceanotoga teriensis TaxID=515440 RepID=A0AA45C7V2_9BACT|nr:MULTISPECIES: folylpolyglutamate synthase/dihydrofolate synthase family protein [Oceanotoga]MDN5341266.1 dihydrofolate synthase / folylpolyglutamate synthase [Oceanotoga sp.]MDO7977007.1 bifunctional folylpolyglutamate synthase/dihydrofolate synthase [Oceanotoga teriensis]PWJ95691.1 dihydrofolate synthase/folylpolyglutamate synthase [Oceanotoga teriensis]UYO99525.1 bifunctional folylpolyglutamate synthase/dihydrofolate synthase [Oceanotoga sp. DSM 15011]
MNFNELLELLYEKKAGNIKIKLGLERMKALIDRMDNPQFSYKVIHVAGTNGKGSITKAVSDMLISQGFKVGTFISPHLIKINERISVDNKLIEDDELLELYNQMSPILESLEHSDEDMSPSFFEIITAMALKYFKDKEVDVAVIEVGLGGRLDSTNVVKSDVSVISNIQKDHTKILGDTLEEIAFEKAGIIKEGNYVVIGDINGSPKEVIKKKAETVNAEYVFEINNNFKYQNPRYSMDWNMIDYYGLKLELKDLVFKANGAYQPHNVSVALATIESFFLKNNYKIDLEKLRESLKEFSWNGRFELIEYNGKKIILEGAHNIEGIKMLKKTLNLYTPFGNKVALVGILDDKDIEDMVKEIPSSFDKIIVTSIENNRSINPRRIQQEMQKYSSYPIDYVEDTSEAFKKLLNERADYYFVTGSLYLVGQIKSFLNCQ